MKAFFMSPFFTITVAVLFSLTAMGFLVNLVLGIIQRMNITDPARRRTMLVQRTALFLAFFAVAVVSTACASKSVNDVPEDDPAVTDPAEPDPATTPEDQTPPAPEVQDFTPTALDYVILTERQMENFISVNGFSIKFDDSSLASRLQERIDAQKQYEGEVFDNPLDFPVKEIMEKLDDLKSGKLSGEELDSWLKDVRKNLYQKIIANPAVGDAWAQMLAKSPLVTENNQWLLVEFLQKMDEFYAIEQVQEITNEDILAGEEPGLIPAGLDYCLQELDDGTIVVNPWYRFNAVRLCYLLDNFSFTGEVTTKTSIRNIGFAITAEDSYSRGVFMEAQENEPALRLVHRQKALNGKPTVVLDYGVNPRDNRPEEFDPKAQPPVVTPDPEPEKPAEKPQPKPTPDPEPELPPETFVTLTFEHRERGTERILRDNASVPNLKTGTLYTYTAPNIADYVCETPTYPVTVPSANKTYVIYYQKVQPKAQELRIDYVFEEDGRTAAPSYLEQLPVGEPFSVRSPDITGFEPDIAIVTGTMDGDGEYFLVKYKRLSFTLTVEHRDAITGEKLIRDHVETVKYDKDYYYVPPLIDAKYEHDPLIVADKMPAHDEVVTVWYYLIEKPRDGEGIKDPNEDPGPQGNAPIGGGENLPGDGPGDFQPEEPPREDYPETPEENPVINPEPPQPPIEDDNGGFTDNGDTPPEDTPIPPDPDTTITDPGTGDYDTPVVEEPPVGGFLPMP